MPKLTDKVLKAFAVEPGRKDRLAFDTECPGLGVRATAKGTRMFLVQWTDPATKRKVREPVGVWGSITLDQARTAARAKLGEVARGLDPAAERRRRKAQADADRAEAALTLDALIEQWATLHLANRRPLYRKEAQRALRFAFGDHLKRPAVRLTREVVVNVMDAVSVGWKGTTAGRTIAYGRACYAWAEKRGKVKLNPFRSLPIAAPSSERDHVLSRAELSEVWAASGSLPYPFGPFYRLAILTLQRRSEVAGIRWSEISADGATWTIPAARMKNNRPHDVHLPPAARAVLAEIPRFQASTPGRRGQARRGGNPLPAAAPVDLVFTTNMRTAVSGYSRAKLQLDAAIVAVRAKAAAETGREPAPLIPWVVHDLRRTGVSHLAALGFDSIVADKLLAHKPAKLAGVASVYQRHDFAAERRKALEAWAAHVTGAKVGGNVVEMPSRGLRLSG